MASLASREGKAGLCIVVPNGLPSSGLRLSRHWGTRSLLSRDKPIVRAYYSYVAGPTRIGLIYGLLRAMSSLNCSHLSRQKKNLCRIDGIWLTVFPRAVYGVGMAQLIPLFGKPKKRHSLYIQGAYFRNVSEEANPVYFSGYVPSTRKLTNYNSGEIFSVGTRVQVKDGPEGIITVITRQSSAWVCLAPAGCLVAEWPKYDTYRLPPEYLTLIK